MAKTPIRPAGTMPSRIEDFEELKQELAKLGRLQVRQKAIAAQISVATSTVSAGDLRQEAEALLAEQGTSTVRQEEAEDQPPLADLRHEHEVVTLAIQIQCERIEQVRQGCFRKVRDAALPGYLDKARQFAVKLVEASQLSDDLRAARDALDALGYASGLPFVGLQLLGSLTDPASIITQLFKEELVSTSILTGKEPFMQSTALAR
jgi:hypothetical protein